MNRKVCFVGSEITPSQGSTFAGGHVNTVVGLCKGLHSLGWEVHIVTTPSRFLKGKIPDFPWAKFHLVHPFGAYNSLSYNADFLFKAVQTVCALSTKNHVDLIHAHSGYFGPAIIPAVVKKRVGLPAIFSLYCPASLLPKNLPLDAIGIRAISIRLDRIIAVTSNVKTSLTNCGVADKKISVIHSCYDENCYSIKSPENKSEVSQEKGAVQRVLFVGNVEKTKGLDIFLSSAKIVLQFKPRVKFIITLHEPSESIKNARILATNALGSSVEVLV